MEQTCRRRQRVAAWICTMPGIAWLAVFPLWQDGSYAHITQTKWQGMLILSGVTVLLSIMGLLLSRKRICWGFPQSLALLYFGWLGLSAVFGKLADRMNERDQLTVWMGAIRYEGMATQLCYFAVFLMMSLHTPRWRAVMNTASVAVVLFGVCVGLQYTGVNVLGLYPYNRSILTNYEFQGTIGNIDMVSGYLSLMVPLLLGGYVMQERQGMLLLAGGMVAVMLMFLIDVESGLLALMTGCCLLAALMLMRPAYRVRGFIVLSGVLVCAAVKKMLLLPWFDGTDVVRVTLPGSMAAVLLVMALLAAVMAAVCRKRPGRGIRLRTMAALGMAVVLIAVGMLYFIPLDEAAGTLWEISEILHGRAQDSFGKERIGVWRMSLDMAKDHLLFGTGQDTFYYAFAEYIEEHESTLVQEFDYPHNEYVAILTNAGIPALAAYFALTGTIVYRCMKGSKNQPVMLVPAAAILCYMVQAHFSFSICLVAPMFWCVMGMAANAEKVWEIQ